MRTNHLLLAYTVASFISVTAYEMYQATLYDYNFGLALASFQMVMLLVLQLPYRIVEQRLLGSMGRKTSRGDGMRQVDAFRRNPGSLILLGICSSAKFGLMLPFLNSLDNSLLFIIFFSLAGLLKVPVAMWIFGDQVSSRSHYGLGLVLATLGGIAYTINPGQPLAIFSGNWLLLSAVFLRVPLDILESMLTRYVATGTSGKRQAVPVENIESIKALFTIAFGLLVATQTLQGTDLLLPNGRQLIGILWIGIVVTITSTFATRLLLELTHTLTQPILSLRPLLAFIPFAFTYLAQGGALQELLYKLGCLCLVLLGTAICLRYGSRRTIA